MGKIVLKENPTNNISNIGVQIQLEIILFSVVTTFWIFNNNILESSALVYIMKIHLEISVNDGRN